MILPRLFAFFSNHLLRLIRLNSTWIILTNRMNESRKKEYQSDLVTDACRRWKVTPQVGFIEWIKHQALQRKQMSESNYHSLWKHGGRIIPSFIIHWHNKCYGMSCKKKEMWRRILKNKKDPKITNISVLWIGYIRWQHAHQSKSFIISLFT